MYKSYTPNYYSFIDISTTQERVNCETFSVLHKLGFLNDSATDDIKVGAEVELPMWLVDDDTFGRYVFYRDPDVYNKVFKEICEADPNAIDLGKINKFYYELGEYLSKYCIDDNIPDLIVETCRKRCKFLIDLCKDTTNESKIDTKMDSSETDLFTKGCKTSLLFANWLMESSASISTFQMVSNHKKRKRQEMMSVDDNDNTNNKNIRI